MDASASASATDSPEHSQTLYESDSQAASHLESTSSPSTPSPSPSEPVDYAQIYEGIKDRSCRVVHIDQQLEGHGDAKFRTKLSLVERELKPIYEASTLQEVQDALETAGRNLQELGVFRNINFLVTEEPQDDPEACTVLARLEEKNWFKVHAATYLQGGENTAEISLGLNNVSGNADHITTSVEYGSDHSSQFSVGYEQPRIADLPIKLDLRVHQYYRNHQKYSSFTEQLRGGIVGIKSMDGMHSLQYELGWRSLLDPSRQASKAVLSQLGDFLKSSLHYTFTIDRRNQPVAATSGWALRATSELAGLGPDAQMRFAKQQVDTTLVLPLNSSGSLGLQLGVSAGLMLPWGPGAHTHATPIADRFFIGGPSSLRGFKYKGVGPTDERRPVRPETRLGEDPPAPKRDVLGGDAFTSVFAALMFQVPHPALQAFRVHGQVFVNGGNSIQLAGISPGGRPRPAQESLRQFGSTFRWTTGVGVVIPTVFGRFEANYCVLLASQEHDKLKRGLQLGFATSSFL